jgi:hypothetical protein
MQFMRVKRLMLAGAVASSLTIGTVDAVFAQEDDTELDGVVEAMPAAGLIGAWQVSGTTVQVTETTEIDQEMGQLAVGVPVEVEGATQPDGSILASELEVEDVE